MTFLLRGWQFLGSDVFSATWFESVSQKEHTAHCYIRRPFFLISILGLLLRLAVV